ncbi:MAG: hypothetical protein R2843_16230 [Thermomicrobiales bacterium]
MCEASMNARVRDAAADERHAGHAIDEAVKQLRSLNQQQAAG